MPDPFQLSAQMNAAPSVQDFSALSAKMDALRSGGQPMQGTAQVDDGWGAVDQSLNIAPKMPVLPPAPRQQEKIKIGPSSFYTGQLDKQYGIDSREKLTDYLKNATETGIIKPMSGAYARQAYRDQVRQQLMPQQQSADPYVPMWRRTEELIGTPQERRARGWR